MGIKNNECSGLTSDECRTKLVWNNLNNADRNVIWNILAVMPTPGACVRDNTIRIPFYYQCGAARWEKRYLQFLNWIAMTKQVDGPCGAGVYWLPNTSAWLNRFYAFNILKGLPSAPTMTPLANFPDKTVLIPYTVP